MSESVEESGIREPTTDNRLLMRSIGPYRIYDVLGKGGMGVVYRGVHSETGEPVAIKTVRLSNAAMFASFRREVRALSAITHPGVVRVVDDGIEEGMPWYAMELLQGVTLRQYTSAALKSLYPETIVDPYGETPADLPRPTLPTAEMPTVTLDTALPAIPIRPAPPVRLVESVLGIVRRLCNTLAYIHGEGIVHRDLKPDNVFVLTGGQPVLVDFGLAASFGGRRGREELDVARRLTGTIAYMSPEQVRGEPVDARADLYALGCVLYELLTGNPPFYAGSALDVAQAHLDTAPTPPSALVSDVPATLDRCVLDLLAKRPSDRIGHAMDVAAILADLGADGDPDPNAPQARPYLYRPGFSGRRQILDTLSRRLTAAADSRGGVILVGGESGSGKTRLAMEFARGAQRRGMSTLIGDCAPVTPTGSGRLVGASPLNGLRKPLQAIADRCREGGPKETERILGIHAALLALFEPALAGLSGASAPVEETAESAEAFREGLFRALAETLEALAMEGPLVLILDDLQWADELTLFFLETALRRERFSSSSLLVLGTFRGEEAVEQLAPLVHAAADDVLELGLLADDEIAVIIGDMLATSASPHLTRLFAERAAGNPFFAAEYLRAAVDDGLLKRDVAGRWIVANSLTRLERLALPATIGELLELRLSGLSTDARATAAAIAVAGREVDVNLLERMCGETDRLASLNDLLRRHVLDESHPGRFGFAHDKLREFVYDSLGERARADLHRAAARAIESSGEIWRGATLADLGHHWECAGDASNAARYYLGAAKAATSRYALAEATRLFTAYFRLAPRNTAESAEAHARFARSVLRPQGRNSDATREYALALDEARAVGARTLEGTVLRWMGALHYEAGRLDEASSHYLLALAIARELHEHESEGRALTNLGALAHDRGSLDEAADLYEQSLAVDPELTATMTNLALLRQQQGRLDEARALYRRALAYASDRGMLNTEATISMNLAILERESGRFDAAAALYDRALTLARSTSNRRFEGMVLGNRADLHWDTGEYDLARTLYLRALAIHRDVGNRRFEGVALSNLGMVAAASGEVETARAAYRDALAIHREVGDLRFEGITLTERAILERRDGNLDEAARFLDEAERAVEEVGEKLYIALVRCARGHLELALGRSARSQIETARHLASELGARPESQLNRSVVALEEAQQALESGRPLVRGEVRS
jgi:serine/threonine protein kinase/tetratricopeptide (TPR) repeat protein